MFVFLASAFAELQTGVLSITNDVEGTGIPMWDYKSYAMWALFPNQPNHPVLRELPVSIHVLYNKDIVV